MENLAKALSIFPVVIRQVLEIAGWVGLASYQYGKCAQSE
jgi:hypothetical protein